MLRLACCFGIALFIFLGLFVEISAGGYLLELPFASINSFFVGIYLGIIDFVFRILNCFFRGFNNTIFLFEYLDFHLILYLTISLRPRDFVILSINPILAMSFTF